MQNINGTTGHALVYSFIVLKYVILILRKEKYILGRYGLYFGRFWGEAELILKIRGAKANYFHGAEDILREHFFSGAQTPFRGGLKNIVVVTLKLFDLLEGKMYTGTCILFEASPLSFPPHSMK